MKPPMKPVMTGLALCPGHPIGRSRACGNLLQSVLHEASHEATHEGTILGLKTRHRLFARPASLFRRQAGPEKANSGPSTRWGHRPEMGVCFFSGGPPNMGFPFKSALPSKKQWVRIISF